MNLLYKKLSKKFLKIRKGFKAGEIKNAMGINRRFKKGDKNRAISYLSRY